MTKLSLFGFATLLASLTCSAQVPSNQYCPVPANFNVRLDVLNASGYFPLEFIANTAPGNFTGTLSASVDENSRVVTVTGRSFLNPFPGPGYVSTSVGPVTPGPYRLIVAFTYVTAPSVVENCPSFEIPIVVPGGAGQTAVPTPSLGKWTLLLLASLLGGIGIATQRRLRRR